MAHPTRSSDRRAQWTKTSSKINQKWSIQHAWSAIVLNGPENRLAPVEVKAKNGTARSLRALVAEVPGLRVGRVEITGDARPGRSSE